MKRNVAAGTLALACTVVLALCAGPTGFRLPWAWTGLIVELRAPRVLLGAIVGAALAVAGTAMQALLHNDLAEPYVLGLSGGASAGAVTSLALWPGVAPGLAAALGAGGAALLVRGVSSGAYDPTRLLLAGVALGSMLASVTGLVLVLAPEGRMLRAASYWLFGGLGTPSFAELVPPALCACVASTWLWTHATSLDRLALGADVATVLGVEPRSLRRSVLIAAVALTGVTVAAAGLVGFVGLIAPHAARRLVGQPHRRMLPIAALVGAWLVTAADTLARTAFAPRELPVGLLTAALGGPFFLLQLRRGLA